MRRYAIPMLALFLGAAVLPTARSQDKTKVPDAVQKSIDAVRKHLDARGGKGAGEILWKSEDAIKLFPDHHLINARFRQFPVARVLPEGMSASNLFAVDMEGKVEHLKDTKALLAFFQKNLPMTKVKEDHKEYLAAWLTLSQEFHQDGFFKFEVLEKEFKLDTNRIAGRAMVTGGGNGELSALMNFNDNGKLVKVDESAKIRPGPRPICQATKLLDPDPVVRRTVEQDLLIMGLAARGYLMEQRERATPALREAIDRIWRQIEQNGW